jgi:hypothetical protein
MYMVGACSAVDFMPLSIPVYTAQASGYLRSNHEFCHFTDGVNNTITQHRHQATFLLPLVTKSIFTRQDNPLRPVVMQPTTAGQTTPASGC